MTCRYCGLQTGSGAGHQSQAECIRALNEEIGRARRLINTAREASPARSADERHEITHEVAEDQQAPPDHRVE
jgi:hypothetical protein